MLAGKCPSIGNDNISGSTRNRCTCPGSDRVITTLGTRQKSRRSLPLTLGAQRMLQKTALPDDGRRVSRERVVGEVETPPKPRKRGRPRRSSRRFRRPSSRVLYQR